MTSSAVPIYSVACARRKTADEQTLFIARVVFMATIAFALICLALAAIDWLV
jgi:hypothetical protein